MDKVLLPFIRQTAQARVHTKLKMAPTFFLFFFSYVHFTTSLSLQFLLFISFDKLRCCRNQKNFFFFLSALLVIFVFLNKWKKDTSTHRRVFFFFAVCLLYALCVYEVCVFLLENFLVFILLLSLLSRTQIELKYEKINLIGKQMRNFKFLLAG